MARTLFLSIIILLSACSKQGTDNTAILYLLGGTSVTITDKDIVREITVTATIPVISSKTINLTCDSKPDEALLEKTSVTINKGETSASTTIMFPASGFRTETAEKKITIRAASDDPLIHFNTSETHFFIKSNTDITLPEITITVKEIRSNTTDENGIAEILFETNRFSPKDITITANYDRDLTVNKEDITWNPNKIIIPAWTKSTSAVIQVKQGTTGTIPLKFSIPNDVGVIGNANHKIIFTVDPLPPATSKLCEIQAMYGAAAFTKTFTVGDYTLTPNHNPDGLYGYEDHSGSITAKITNDGILSIQLQSSYASVSDTYTLAAWVDWNRSGRLTEDEAVFYKTINAPAKGQATTPYTAKLQAPKGTADGKYIMRIGTFYNENQKLNGGCGIIDSGDITDITIDFSENATSEASLFPNDETNVIVGKNDVAKTFTIARSGSTLAPAIINLAVTTTGSDTPTLSPATVTIPANTNSAESTVTFKSATPEQDSEVTVEITSASGLAVNPAATKITYSVTYSPVSDIPPVKLCPFSVIYRNYIFTESFTAGDYTLTPKHNTTDKTYGYTALATTANLKNGDPVSITYGNQDGSSGTYISAAWVDWNRDGNVDDSEKILYREWNTSYETANSIIGTVKGILKAPAGTKTGTYIMRIGSSSKKNLTGGCGKVENADMFDIRIDYTE